MVPITIHSNQTDHAVIQILDDNVWENSELFVVSIVGLAVGSGFNDTVVKVLDDDREYPSVG